MSMTMAAKAAWPLLWTEADDHGIFEWKPIVLKARIFPADNIEFNDVLLEYKKLGCIMSFMIGDRRFGAIRNFCKFQRPQKPSYKFPTNDQVLSYTMCEGYCTGTIPVSEEVDTTTVKSPPMKEEGGKGRGKEEEVIETPNGVVPPSAADLTDAVADWNKMAVENGLPSVQHLTETRKKHLVLRLQEVGGLPGWATLMEVIRGSPHLLGRTDDGRGWKATFDWILKPSNLTKTMEGNYRGSTQGHKNSNGGGRSQRSDSISRSFDAVIGGLDKIIAETDGGTDEGGGAEGPQDARDVSGGWNGDRSGNGSGHRKTVKPTA